MAEQVPCFQLGFDVLNVENSDDFEESSGEVACNFTNFFFCLKCRYRDVLTIL